MQPVNANAQQPVANPVDMIGEALGQDDLLVEANGPFEFGISATSEAGVDPTCSVNFAYSNRQLVRWCHALFRREGIADAKLLRAFTAGILFIKRNVLHDASCNVTVGNSAPVAQADVEWANTFELSREDMAIGATLAFSTKVTFWQTNHHVGQGRLAGYFRKYALITFKGVAENTLARVGWILGHAMSTKRALKQLGVPNIDDPWNRVAGLNFGRDVMVRIAGVPAGCAKLAFVAAAADRLLNGMFRTVVAPPVGLEEVIRAYRTVCGNPAPYHIGGAHLTNLERQVAIEVPDHVLIPLATYVRAVMPDSTLAKAKCIPGEDVTAAHEWFAVLSSARRALMQASIIPQDQIDAIVQAERDRAADDDTRGAIQLILADANRIRALREVVRDAVVAPANVQA